ncbi:uncharacterized protein LOC125646573 isoform X2 [Ostrea edulis]|uniref:uncharacterized protein LOC125646573 isoform X2 n=1 Tax=Ostrea edulis TaxID=37623 RepID=UPI0024AF9549|nr:uncharacterized protein LOC125646573 isoform X2 [Ostrea edulis]
METEEDNTPQVSGEQGQNTYVELVTENHDVVIQGIKCKSTSLTKSQKKRRRNIPLRYHENIFKNSRKKKYAPASSCREQRAEGKTETQVEKCRESMNSSSYISCKTHRTVSDRSDLSSHLYDDIDECIQSRERCYSISTASTFSSMPPQRVNNAVHDPRAGRGNLREQTHESSSNRNQIHYQIEVPKKAVQGIKKYMGLFCMILVCAVISTIIAILVSKNVLGNNSPNVKNGNQSTSIPNFPDAQYMQEIFFNATHEGGKSNSGIIRQDFTVMKEELKEDLSKMIHGINFTVMKEELKEDLSKMIHGINFTVMKEELKEDLSKMMQGINFTVMKEELKEDLSKMMQDFTVMKEELKEDLSKMIQGINFTAMKEELREDLSKMIHGINFTVMKEELKEDLSKMIQGIRCVSSCNNRPDGDYQSCYTCHGFVSCSNGKLDNKICAPYNEIAPTYWDDFQKSCNYTSDTCKPEYIFKRTAYGII